MGVEKRTCSWKDAVSTCRMRPTVSSSASHERPVHEHAVRSEKRTVHQSKPRVWQRQGGRSFSGGRRGAACVPVDVETSSCFTTGEMVVPHARSSTDFSNVSSASCVHSPSSRGVPSLPERARRSAILASEMRSFAWEMRRDQRVRTEVE